MEYSVLMAVYSKEKPENLKTAIDSICKQTIKTNDFVIVCDGPLTKELDEIIEQSQNLYSDIITVIRLPENNGLGHALNMGLQYCKNEWVGRMDSDDISLPKRFEKQIELIEKDNRISICCTGIQEFGISNKKRITPQRYEEILSYSKKRCPFNHPSVMYKKSVVIDAGGYLENNNKFEDYPLWIRILKMGIFAENIPDVLLEMRVTRELFYRRGGFEYACEMLKFRRWMVDIGWTSELIFLLTAIPHFVVCVLPANFRAFIYKFLRSK